MIYILRKLGEDVSILTATTRSVKLSIDNDILVSLPVILLTL